MTYTKEDLPEISKKIFLGTASPEEAEFFWSNFDQMAPGTFKEVLFSKDIPVSYAADSPRDAALEEEKKRTLRAILSVMTPVHAITAGEVIASEETAGLSRVVPMRKWLRYAAAAVFMVTGATLYYLKAGRTGKIAIAAAAIKWDSIANPGNTPRKITLPDNTTVWLNNEAVLYVNKAYADNRLVRLKGEGYFDVAQQAEHPFRVLTGAITTTVLGTRFNVDDTHSGYRISLVQGNVKVAQGEKNDDNEKPTFSETPATGAVLLTPGETAFVPETDPDVVSHPAIQKRITRVPDVTGWIRGDLVFNQVPLKEALEKIGRKYHVTIQAGDRLLANKEVNAVYPSGQDVDTVLTQLLFIYQLHFQKGKEGSIQITG